MIGHINNEKQSKLENLKTYDLQQQNLINQKSISGGILQQEPVLKNKENHPDPLKMREQLCNKYDKAVIDYQRAQDKKHSDGSALINGVIAGISLEQATEYIARFPELDISDDQVLVKNYSLLMDAKKMVDRMKSISGLLGGSMVEPEIKEKYHKLTLITDYAGARFSCMENVLFGKLKQEDLTFIENAPDLDTVLARKIKGVDDNAAKRNLEELFKNLKKSKSLLDVVRGEDRISEKKISSIEDIVEGDLDKSFNLEKEDDDEDDIILGINKDVVLNEQQEENNIVLNNQEAPLQNEQRNRFEEQRLDRDRIYLAQNFAYSTLLTNKRAGNKEDGAEMKAVKNALRELQNAAIFEQKSPRELGQIYARLIPALEEYVRTHDVFYKAVFSEGAERLTLVKNALYRARLEQRQLWALHAQRENEGAVNQNPVLKEEGDSRTICAKMAGGIDALKAVEKNFADNYINGKNKEANKKDRIVALSRLFYQTDVLAEADRDKYALLGGTSGIAGHMLRSMVDSDMLRDFYLEKDRLTMKLVARYNAYRRHPVPAAFLKNREADPWDESVRDQYALLRIMHDEGYRQLAGFEKMEECLLHSDNSAYDEASIKRMGIKSAADRMGAAGAINSVLARLKSERKDNYDIDEEKLIGEGTALFNKLKGIANAGNANADESMTYLDPAQISLMRFSETNEARKAMKTYGLSQTQTGEESETSLHEEFIEMNPQYADVQLYDPAQGKVFEKEYRMKKGAERTDRRFAQSGIAPESNMKKRGLLTGFMANLLNMGELVSQDSYGEIKEGGKTVLGIYKQPPLGKYLNELDGYKMENGLSAEMSKLVFLNIICGQMNLDSAMLSVQQGKLLNGSESFTIDKIRLDRHTEYSFGALSGDKLLQAYKNGRHAKLLEKLDDQTKAAILNLSPIVVEQYFGAYLNAEEMNALLDRVRTVQRYLTEAGNRQNEQENSDTYAPKREYIEDYEELNYEKVKDYLALPEKERAKRRAENICSHFSVEGTSISYSNRFTKKVWERISAETGLSDQEITNLFHGRIKKGNLTVDGGLDGNRFANGIVRLLNQEMTTEDDLYMIMKGLYAEPLSKYTHNTKEEINDLFDRAVDKVKDIMLERFGRLVEKYGNLPALLNPDDFLVMVDGAEIGCLLSFLQDLNQMVDEVKGGSLFDKNDPRDAKLLLMQEYANAFNMIISGYEGVSDTYNQNQNIKQGAFDEADQNAFGEIEDADDSLQIIRESLKTLIEAAAKLGMGPALSKEEYDSYISGCENRFANRPLARAIHQVQKEELKDIAFVKKEKKEPEDDSDYVAQVEELRKQGNNNITVEGLKLREKLIQEKAGIQRIENEFYAEKNINPSDIRDTFDGRSIRLFLRNYERDENGKPLDDHAKKIHKQNNDFLEALCTGDRKRMRPHIDRVVSKLLSYDISIEHLKDKNWVMRHPEIVRISAEFAYISDCIKNNEEYAWYFEELSPEARALLISRMDYIMTLSPLLLAIGMGPALGFTLVVSNYKIYTGREAEGNCKPEDEAWAEYKDGFNETMSNKRDDGSLIDLDHYEIIKHRPNSPEGKNAIDRVNQEYQRGRQQSIQTNKNAKIEKLNAFYSKYAARFSKEEKAKPHARVTSIRDRKIIDNKSKEVIGNILADNWTELAGDKYKVINKVKIESTKTGIGTAHERYSERLSMLRSEEKDREKFRDICMRLPQEIRWEKELYDFYSFYRTSLSFMKEDEAAENLAFVITNYLGDESSKKVALDAVTHNILNIATDEKILNEKNLKGSFGLALEEMSKSYTEMLRQNPSYVEFLKSKTDPKTGKTYFNKVSDAMDIIRACSYYAKVYNTLKRDPVFASSDAGFLSAPVSAMDTYEVRRAKTAIAKLDELGGQILKGEYQKADIDNYDLINSQEQEINDFCSKFSESKGNERAATQDIKAGLSAKIGAIQDTDKKVLELTKLLSALDVMENDLGWKKDSGIEDEIKRIAGGSPKEMVKAAIRLRQKLSADLARQYKRFLKAEIPQFLADPEFKGKKKEQKESAALLMLTTTAAYRNMVGVDKLLDLMKEAASDKEIRDEIKEFYVELSYDDNEDVYKEALFSATDSSNYEGLSEEGIFEARDMTGRVNRRVSKAILSSYTQGENVGYMERTPITSDEINGWIKNIPMQEERARKAPQKPLDPKVLSDAEKILPRLKSEYSEKITKEMAAIVEKLKSDNMKLEDACGEFNAKWIKGEASDYHLDPRDHIYYKPHLDGCSMEVLLSDEPKAREYYVDQYVRLAMSIDVSWDNLNVEWLTAHYDEISIVLNMGTYFQNMQSDNPEYFVSMPKAFLEILDAKMYMLGIFASAMVNKCCKQDVKLIAMDYLQESFGSGDPDYISEMDEGIADQKIMYDKARQKMLWLCRSYNLENNQGENKYSDLRNEINSFAYTIKPLTMDSFKKADQAQQEAEIPQKTLAKYKEDLNWATGRQKGLAQKAQELIPENVRELLTVAENDALCAMYPFILERFEEGDIKTFAEAEFKKLCLRMAGMEGAPSEEEAKEQKKTALDTMAEYIMLYSIDDPGFVENDQAIAKNADHLEVLSAAVKNFKALMNSSHDWKEEKNNKQTTSGKTEGELLDQQVSVLEAVREQYMSRKAVIIR